MCNDRDTRSGLAGIAKALARPDAGPIGRRQACRGRPGASDPLARPPARRGRGRGEADDKAIEQALGGAAGAQAAMGRPAAPGARRVLSRAADLYEANTAR